MVNHEVIYLTGAPATGKSTAASNLSALAGAKNLSYGELLTQQLSARVMDQDELRSRSAQVISAADVVHADATMIDLIQAGRDESMVVVDSHALTIEHFGFRAVPYSAAQLISINFTWIVCLYASPSVIQERIRIKPGGRPLPSEADLARHEQLQSALALTYAHTLGAPIAFVDAAAEPLVVAKQILEVVGFRRD